MWPLEHEKGVSFFVVCDAGRLGSGTDRKTGRRQKRAMFFVVGGSRCKAVGRALRVQALSYVASHSGGGLFFLAAACVSSSWK